MIHFIQPYGFDRNIGGAYNKACEGLEGWICITDQDTLKFEGFADRVRQITNVARKTDVITCRTNRLRRDNTNVLMDYYNESDINVHQDIFNRLWDEYGVTLDRTSEPIAGVCMIFHSTVFEKVKFTEWAINFDSLFTTHCRNAGFITYVAKGLYIFHLYRWGRNVADTSHLDLTGRIPNFTTQERKLNYETK